MTDSPVSRRRCDLKKWKAAYARTRNARLGRGGNFRPAKNRRHLSPIRRALTESHSEALRRLACGGGDDVADRSFVDSKKLFLQRIECELKTISDVIRERQVATIALVKIDVEGSEWDVIEGIAEEDWPKIRQFVVEAHDVDGRVEKMRSVFEAAVIEPL